jgi:Glycine-rich domain
MRNALARGLRHLVTDEGGYFFPQVGVLFGANVAPFEAQALVVAGGGDGGAGADDPIAGGAGGGGAGGFQLTTRIVTAGESWPVVVGAASQDSSVFGVLSLKGAFGQSGDAISDGHPPSPGTHGSGGGGSEFSTLGGFGTPGQGNDGAENGGGGGGAGAVGTPGAFGLGGVGISNSYSGTPILYCNGGPGAAGGLPGDNGSTPGSGGGGGDHATGGTTGGLGAAGIVIIRYLGLVPRATGGSITNDGTYTIHTFTSNGTFTATS